MSRRSQALTALFVLSLAASSSRFAHAQSASDKAAAETLFEEGKALLARGALEEACPKLAESLRLDSGVGTMLYLAECWERSGKTASAWAQFREAQSVAASTKDAREKVARARADKLEPKLSRLAIVVPSESEVEGLTITRNEVDVGRALWGTEMPVDPGEHVVRANAPSKLPFEMKVEISAGGARERIEIPVLADRPPEEPTEEPPAATTDADTGPTSSGEGLPTQRVVALALGGVGVVGLGLGTFFGLRAMSSLDAANAHCDDRFCNEEGLGFRDDARTEANVSTIAFAASALAIGGGIALWVTAPKTKAKAKPPSGIWGWSIVPGVGPRSAAVSASTRF